MNAYQLARHRRHLTRLLDFAVEHDSNLQAAIRELAKDDYEGTLLTREQLALARCASTAKIESIGEAIRLLPDQRLKVVA